MKLNLIILLNFFIFSYNQVPKGYALNTCGLDSYDQPQKKEDCKINEKEKFRCCFIKSVLKEFSYCCYVPGKVDDEIINDFIETLEISDLVVECNNQFFLKLNFCIFVLFFVSIF